MLSMMIIALRNGVDRVEAMILARVMPRRVLARAFRSGQLGPDLASLESPRVSIHAR